MESEKVKEIKKALEQNIKSGLGYEDNDKFCNVMFADILTLINELEARTNYCVMQKVVYKTLTTMSKIKGVNMIKLKYNKLRTSSERLIDNLSEEDLINNINYISMKHERDYWRAMANSLRNMLEKEKNEQENNDEHKY